jgi:hypothetical protein
MVLRFHIFAFPAGSARKYFPGLFSLDAAVAFQTSQLFFWTLDIRPPARSAPSAILHLPSIGQATAKKFQCLDKAVTKGSDDFHPSDFSLQNSTFNISSAFQFPLHCQNVEV